MKRFQYIVAVFILCSITFSVSADADKDAQYIVDQTINEKMFKGAMSAFAPVLASALKNDLQQKGIVVSDIDTFTRITFEEFIGEFTTEMKEVTKEKYLQTFSPTELSDIARFMHSTSGKRYLDLTPDLMQFGAQQGGKIGKKVGRRLGPKIAKRLKEEGVEITEAGMMDKLIEALKQQ